jgi:dTDP-4-amino-4,6-dideoxygalactose transaminase
MNRLAIPFHRPSLGEEEKREISRVLDSGWLTSGPAVAQFEAEFRTFAGARFAAAVNSGTAGMHVALTALGVGHGDEVITTPLTFCSTVHAISQTGATPVLADVGEDGNIDPEMVVAKITSRTKAILPVHLGGLPCDLRALRGIARVDGLHVVEDAAHAAASCYDGAPIGSGSDAVVFSFYATKNITAAEGGMVTTPHRHVDDRIRRLSLHGIDKAAWTRESNGQSWKYDVVETGFKYNLSDLHAAVGLAQLRKSEKFTAARRRLAQFYNSRFRGVEELELPSGADYPGHSWHLYAVRLRLDALRISRDTFIEELGRRGIGASVHFVPIPLHRAFRDLTADPQRECPRALQLYPRLLSLPIYPALDPALDDTQAGFVAAAVIDIAKSNRR